MTFQLEDISHAYTKLIRLKKTYESSQFLLSLLESLTAFDENYEFDVMYRQGLWDGKRKFYEILDNGVISIPKGLVPIIVKEMIERGFKPNVDFSYKSISKGFRFKENEFENFIFSLNLKYTPYDYQFKAIKDILQRKRGIFRAATSSGKSLMIYGSIRYLLSQNKKIILIVPSIGLVNQMYNDFLNYGWDKEEMEKTIKRIGGDHNKIKGFNKDLTEKPLIITTWQSIYQLNHKSFSHFDAVFVDEVHGAKQGELEKLIYKIRNAEYRIGLTGTVPTLKVHRLSLQGSLGKVYTVIKARELIDRGLATNVEINAIYLNYPAHERLQHKVDYATETKFVESHKGRNDFSAKLLDKISEKGNTIGLFNRFEQGSAILEELVQLRLGERNPFRMLYSITRQSIDESMQEWLKSNKKLRIYVNSEITEEDRKNIKYYAEYVPNLDVQEFIDSIIFTSDSSSLDELRRKKLSGDSPDNFLSDVLKANISIGMKPVEKAYRLWKKGETIYFDVRKLKYYSNKEFTKEQFEKNKNKYLKQIKILNRNKILEYAKKIPNENAQEFIKSIDSLAELNIYFYNGNVNATLREKIRQELETIDNNSYKIDFGEFVCFAQGDKEYLLENGNYIRGCDITEETDLKIINNNIVER